MDDAGTQGIELKTGQEATQPYGGILALLADGEVGVALIPMPRIGGDPVTEFRAFQWGDNPTTKGVLRLTPDGAQKLMDRFRERGVAKCFDYFHATYDPHASGENKKAAGQFVPELRADGLWFVRIQWTPKAAQAIRDGEWPYISPAVDHDKSGVILNLRNAGLVTDPGTIGAQPTTLSEASPNPYAKWLAAAKQLLSLTPLAEPPTRISMADKKRMMLDAYAAVEMAMRRCQALADTDGMDKDLGNKMVGGMAPIVDAMRAHMMSAGYMDDAMLASSKKLEEGKQKMLAALADEFKETDPEKLSALLFAKLDGKNSVSVPHVGVLLSDADAAKVSALLVDGHAAKIPTTRRDMLKAQGPAAIATYLAASMDITPSGPAPREAAPMAPTTEATIAATPNAKTPESPSKPRTLADCTPQQRAMIDGQLAITRAAMGEKFDEKLELEHAFAALSDLKPIEGNQIRHMPFGAALPTMLTGDLN